jgi:hypothetical protein
MAFAVNKIGLEKPYISFSSLSYYNSFKAFGLGPDRVLDKNKFWSIYRKDDSGSYQVPIVLTKAAEDNVVVTWSFSGSAVDGTHYTCPISSITIRPGTLIGYIPIEIIDRGKWFKEKDLIITLNAPSNTILAKDQDKVRIVFVPSTAPPEITVSTTLTGDFSGINLLDPETDWTVGTGNVGSSIGSWAYVGTLAENSRQTLTNPHGDSAVVWVAENIESANTFDGGFKSPIPMAVDPTKTYRRSVWFKLEDSTEGRFRWTHQQSRREISPGSSTLDVIYFSDFLVTSQVGEWYLAVSYIHPYNYTGASTGLSQIYSADGTAVAEVREFLFNDASDTNDFIQAGLFNDPTDNNEEVWFWDPRYDLVDGSEPSITGLLNGYRGTSLPATFTASYAPEEDITVRYKVSGTAADGVGANNGDATIPAGSTTATLALPYGGTHASGSTVVLSADYERNTVAFTELDWDPVQGSFSVPRDVHIDENMWPQSQDLVSAGFDQSVTGSADKPWWPGYPTQWGIDGSIDSTDPSLTGYKVDIVEQSATTKIVDPVTGNAIKWFVPNDHVVQLVPYLRNAFSLTWPGGRSTAHQLKEWTRGAFRIIPMDAADIDHQAEFFEISQRVRTQNTNHVAKFRWKDVGSPGFGTGTPGLASNGETVPVYTPPSYPNIRIWLWDLVNPHPAAVSSGWAGGWGTWYGAFEDEHGLGVYFIHRLDTAVTWGGKVETPDVDKGNHILWPVGLDEGLASVKANQTGMLWHSMQTQMSSSPLSGPPTDFWPGLGTVWTPWGNAVIDPATTTSVTFTKA